MNNSLKERLTADQPITIAMVTMPSVAAMQVWARTGVDCLLIDLEHGPIGLENVHAMTAATTGTPATPLVRVPWNVPWLVKPVLDAGALGICFPMIADAADAEMAVRSLRYPPDGDRGWGPFYAHLRWGETPAGYVARANDAVFAMLLIERPEAILRFDEIVRVPGIDMLVIAPFDLSVIMGRPGEVGHPDVQAAIAQAERTILASGVPLGGAALTPEAANAMVERGYRGLFLGFDWMILQRAVAGYLGALTPRG